MASSVPYFYQWETKGFELTFADEDGQPLENPALEGWQHVVVSFGQNGREKVSLSAVEGGESDEGISVDESTDSIEVRLSQEDTSTFKEGDADVQVNIYYHDRERDATLRETVEVRANLHRKVMR